MVLKLALKSFNIHINSLVWFLETYETQIIQPIIHADIMLTSDEYGAYWAVKSEQNTDRSTTIPTLFSIDSCAAGADENLGPHGPHKHIFFYIYLSLVLGFLLIKTPRIASWESVNFSDSSHIVYFAIDGNIA